MLITNTDIEYKWIIKKHPNPSAFNEAYFDLQVTAPDGAVTYHEGSGWADSFLKPTDIADGYITYKHGATGFQDSGVYVLILGTGGSASFTILDTMIVYLAERSLQHTEKVTLT